MKQINDFDFEPGEIIKAKYEILEQLGKGWEGEVYLIKELDTGIERAAKFFYPKRNKNNKTSRLYAKKLHKLRNCDIIIQYFTQDEVFIQGHIIKFLISDFIEGEILASYLKRQPGKRLQPFTALHFLYALAKGMECVHRMKEYHGDLHTDNIIVQKVGLGFDLKLVDLYNWGPGNGEHIKDDVVEMIRIFHEILGGQKHYAKMPKEIKDICCGLKKTLILKKYKTAGKLREYLENMQWK
ncbi:protein kinase family protein [Candidatus Woesearchaeota archaeon]|nr:protein kinase family protein [Candidatus Woesearchaeota archaeon]